MAKSAFTKPINNFYLLIVTTLSLSLFGLVMVFSASSIYSLDTKGTSFGILLRQLTFLVISIPAAIVMARIPLFGLKRIAKIGLLLAIVLMLILRVPGFGKSVNGNTNWISLGFVDVQPSELAKFFLILWAAYMLSRKEEAAKALEML